MSNLNTNPKRGRLNSEEISYQNGYVEGRDQESRLDATTRNDSGSGVLLGVVLAILAGMVVGTMFYLSSRNQPATQNDRPTQILPIPVPNTNNSQPQSGNKETTIIERTINNTKQVIPVPQNPQPAAAPKVNINLPSPAKQEAPEAKQQDSSTESSAQPKTATTEPESSNSEP